MDNKPRIPDAIDQQKLSYMQFTARMKESADKHGVGFIGGFVTPDGEVFSMTNLDAEDVVRLLIDKFISEGLN